MRIVMYQELIALTTLAFVDFAVMLSKPIKYIGYRINVSSTFKQKIYIFDLEMP